MRAFLLSLAVLVAATGGAAFALGSLDMSSQTVFSSQGARH